jgi:O-antigen/teichoic acid export membrane protein
VNADLTGSELRERTADSVLVLWIRGIGLRVIALAGYVVLARLLAPRDFGVAAIGLSVTFVAQALAESGFGYALVREAREPTRADHQAVVALQLAALAPVVVGVLGWALVAQSKPAAVTALFAAGLPFLAFRLPASIELERELRFRPIALSGIGEALAFNVTAIVAVVAGAGVYGLAGAAIVRALVGTVILNRIGPVGWVRPRLDRERSRGWLGFGVNVQLSGVLSEVRDLSINVGTSFISGYRVLGLWTIANRLMSIPFLLFDAMWRVAFPALTRMIASGEDPDAAIKRGIGMAAVLAGIFLAPLAVAGQPLLELVLGSRWEPAGVVIPAVALGMVLSFPISVVATGYLYARGESATVLRIDLAMTFTCLVVTFALLAPVGYRALGYGQLASACVDGSLLTLALRARGISGATAAVVPIAGWIAAVAAGLGLLEGTGRGYGWSAIAALLSAGLFALAMATFQRALARSVVRQLRAALRRVGQAPRSRRATMTSTSGRRS